MQIFSQNISGLISDDKFLLHQKDYNPNLNLKYETIFTLTNGYMGVRGSFEEGSIKEHRGTYIAGVFDKSDAAVNELVNIQNWLGLRIYIDDSPITPDSCEILDFDRVLDMKKGMLFRRMKYKDGSGKITLIEGYRFLSRNNVHRAGIKMYVTPVNYSGMVLLESTLDGTVMNSVSNPFQRVKHLKMSENSSFNNKECYLEMVCKDNDTHVSVGTALRTYDSGTGFNLAENRRTTSLGEQLVEFCEFQATQGKTVEIDKFVTAYTTREVSKSDIKKTVLKELDGFILDGFETELRAHAAVYAGMWFNADIEIEGDDEANRALKFNIFHLMSSANEKDPRVNIAAKALHGEGYKGHVFWDTEIFMLPFFIYTFPEAAKALLLYRYNLLEAAKENAKLGGYQGARYPWESADTGLEETPKWGRNYYGEPVRIWTGDIEYHVGADIAYAIYYYYRVTGDIDFILEYGLEILLETARFWSSRCEYRKELDRYEINCVIGPDEFHEHIDNNFYTNYFARWNIKKALDLLEDIKDKYPRQYRSITSKTLLTQKEIAAWKNVMNKIYIPYDEKTKLIEQFEGYFERKDFIIEEHDENDMPVWPKGADLAKLNDTKLVKQADVIMLLLLLGDEFDENTKKINYEYYEKRTMHKSSLSPSMYALMGLKVGEDSRAYKYFLRTACVDLVDNQGNTGEGIHAASLGGTWQVAVYGFAGMYIDGDGILNFDPWLPEKWERLRLRVFWKGCQLEVDITQEDASVTMLQGTTDSLTVKIKNKTVVISNNAPELNNKGVGLVS